MELQTAIEILEYHQEWRLGKREDMIHEPKKLTAALDMVLSEVKKFSLGAVTRVEVIDHYDEQPYGRAYARCEFDLKVKADIQDEGRTLKLFVSRRQ